MLRVEIVDKLLKEGFSERTLCNLTDNQIKALNERIVVSEQESTINIPKDDKLGIENAKKQKKPFMTYEEDESDIVIEFEEEEDKFHPMTTKKEISEMVKKKMKK